MRAGPRQGHRTVEKVVHLANEPWEVLAARREDAAIHNGMLFWNTSDFQLNITKHREGVKRLWKLEKGQPCSA